MTRIGGAESHFKGNIKLCVLCFDVHGLWSEGWQWVVRKGLYSKMPNTCMIVKCHMELKAENQSFL